MQTSQEHDQLPQWANRFLEWYCSHELLDEIQGDLLEAFYYRKQTLGLKKARWWFIWDVIKFFRPSSFRKRSFNSNQTAMFKNNIKIALRVISRKKWASFINIISLTLGITAMTLISLFVVDEFSYDNFHSNKEHIHRLVTDKYLPDGSLNYIEASQPLPLAKELATDFSDIEAISRVSRDKRYVRIDKNMAPQEVLLADTPFFEMFSFPFLIGNEKQALEYSENVVVSKDFAMRHFQSIDVLGKTVEIRQDDTFKQYLITGVIEEIPSNSTFKFDLAINYDQVGYYRWASTSWGVIIDEIYVSINENVQVEALNEKVKYYWKKHLVNDLEESKNFTGEYQNYWFQPLTDVHLASDVSSRFSTGDPMNSYLLAIIAIIILLIGSANFTILEIGRSTMRSKEVAVKKVIGAQRKQLVSQFWTESITLSVFAMFLSLIFIVLLLPAFNQLAEKNFQMNDILNIRPLLLLLTIAIFTGLIAGTYPAFVLSNVRILDFFKKRMGLGGANIFTKSLITLQFSLSVMLLLGTIIVFQQIDFLKSTDLGYESENVIVLENMLSNEPEKLELYKSILAKNPKIKGTAALSSSFGRGGFSSPYEKADGTKFTYSSYFVEPSVFSVMDIDITSGRNFNEELTSDKNSVIVNQRFMEAVSGDFEIGDRITGFKNMGLNEPKIIGVTEDFHFQSLAYEVMPAIMLLSKSGKGFENFMVKTTEKPDSELLPFLEKSWFEIAPNTPFQYVLMNADLERQYEAEVRWFAIVKLASLWSMGLALLGLTGMIGLSIAGRLKEMSIRKVLGASGLHLYYVISRQFLVILTIALAIAIPVVVYFANSWLDNFAYHIELNPLVFGGVIGLVFLLLIFIIYLVISKSLNNNPVDSLRME
ncbi:MAG: ABC transporter permease [Cytophagia bacterium]|nr:ABC transporter permease [Cytophagia bacterium]